MAKKYPGTPVPAPAFVRKLARLGGVDVPASGQALAEGLGQWIDWNRAVVLSRALDDGLTVEATDALADDHEAGECARVRAALADAIATTCGSPTVVRPTPGRGAPAGTDPDGTADYAIFHKDYLSLQRSMQAATGRLRGRLRDRLAGKSPGMARLAEVDAVMEQVLSPREQALLTQAPVLLQERFERLRRTAAAAAGGEGAEAAAAPAGGAWQEVFRRDMQDALLAELEVRFHPIEGLLAALRTEQVLTS